MNLSLERRWRSTNCTISDLFVDGVWQCYILEDRLREIEGVEVAVWKVPNETAIPSGRYKIIKDFSNRFQRITLHILDVPDFTGIRIHPGNISADTDGCLLPGTNRNDTSSVSGSKIACEALEAKIFPALDRNEEVWINVVNPQGATPEQMMWV